MIAAWMLYGLVAGGALLAVAVLLDGAARRTGRPTRFVWLGAMAATVALSALVLWPATSAPSGPGLSGSSPASGGRSFVPVEWWSAAAADGSPGVAARLDAALGAAWLSASVLAVALFLGSALRLRRRRARWRREVVRGVSVLVTDGAGPAVIGFVSPAIVVPSWVLMLDAASQELVLEHERQHAAERDPLLMVAAFAAVALLPWNAPLWVMRARLRRSVEMDCDARVLSAAERARDARVLAAVEGTRDAGVLSAVERTRDARVLAAVEATAAGVGPDRGARAASSSRAAYASLLIEMGARTSGVPALAPAHVGWTTDLERRVLAILQPPARSRPWRLGARLAAGAVLAVAAAAAPRPAVRVGVGQDGAAATAAAPMARSLRVERGAALDSVGREPAVEVARIEIRGAGRGGAGRAGPRVGAVISTGGVAGMGAIRGDRGTGGGAGAVNRGAAGNGALNDSAAGAGAIRSIRGGRGGAGSARTGRGGVGAGSVRRDGATTGAIRTGRGGGGGGARISSLGFGVDSIAALVERFHPEVFAGAPGATPLVIAFAFDTTGRVTHTRVLDRPWPDGIPVGEAARTIIELFPELSARRLRATGRIIGDLTREGRPPRRATAIYGVFDYD